MHDTMMILKRMKKKEKLKNVDCGNQEFSTNCGKGKTIESIKFCGTYIAQRPDE